jgi:hypothetical protein
MTEPEIQWLLGGLLFFAKLGDNISTRLVTPALKLESNALVRRMGWKFIWLTLLVCLVPWVSLPAAVAILPLLLIVAATNFTSMWLARALGEAELLDFYTRAAGRGSFRLAMVSEALRSLYLAVAGGALILMTPEGNWARWFGVGIIASGPLLMLHHISFYRKIFHAARLRKAEAEAAPV